jgi:uncharacterized membrane protein HdeD (DUF308 family)
MHFLPITGFVAGILSILAGIAVVVWPRILPYVVGIYLIVVGVVAVIAALR